MPLQNKTIKYKAFIFLLCLLIATIVWTINKLTKEYSYEIPYTVCIHSSTNNIPPICADNVMYVRVTAKGFYIMKHRVKAEELNIDIKKLKLTRIVNENNVSEYMLSTSLIQSAVKEAIGDAVRIEDIITESLFFNSGN